MNFATFFFLFILYLFYLSENYWSKFYKMFFLHYFSVMQDYICYQCSFIITCVYAMFIITTCKKNMPDVNNKSLITSYTRSNFNLNEIRQSISAFLLSIASMISTLDTILHVVATYVEVYKGSSEMRIHSPLLLLAHIYWKEMTFSANDVKHQRI